MLGRHGHYYVKKPYVLLLPLKFILYSEKYTFITKQIPFNQVKTYDIDF